MGIWGISNSLTVWPWKTSPLPWLASHSLSTWLLFALLTTVPMRSLAGWELHCLHSVPDPADGGLWWTPPFICPSSISIKEIKGFSNFLFLLFGKLRFRTHPFSLGSWSHVCLLKVRGLYKFYKHRSKILCNRVHILQRKQLQPHLFKIVYTNGFQNFT